MAQDATLHIKLDRATDERLKQLAHDRRTSKGQLVREAISACYPSAVENLPLQQKQALTAYQGGYISLGKLARVMGLHALEMRRWLDEHGIAQQSVYGDGDAANA